MVSTTILVIDLSSEYLQQNANNFFERHLLCKIFANTDLQTGIKVNRVYYPEVIIHARQTQDSDAYDAFRLIIVDSTLEDISLISSSRPLKQGCSYSYQTDKAYEIN